MIRKTEKNALKQTQNSTVLFTHNNPNVLQCFPLRGQYVNTETLVANIYIVLTLSSPSFSCRNI